MRIAGAWVSLHDMRSATVRLWDSTIMHLATKHLATVRGSGNTWPVAWRFLIPDGCLVGNYMISQCVSVNILSIIAISSWTYIVAKLMASSSGGGMRKQTPGTRLSWPAEFCIVHFVFWKLSRSTHSSPFEILICNNKAALKDKNITRPLAKVQIIQSKSGQYTKYQTEILSANELKLISLICWQSKVSISEVPIVFQYTWKLILKCSIVWVFNNEQILITGLISGLRAKQICAF